MFVIRREQMDAFRAAALRSFEDEMVEHLATFSPPLFKAVGEEQMRKAIRLGITRADGYGFTHRGPVRLYLELMLLFGSHFDTDPQYPWANQVLTNRDALPQMQRAERLYDLTMDYRAKVAGAEDAYTLRALRNIAAFARQPLTISSEDFVPAMLHEIAMIYPEKAAYVGDQNLSSLIRKAMDGARIQRFSTTREMALVVVLMIAFGHGCGADPLYPWIARTLKDEAIVDPAARAMRLKKKALTWLEHVLAHFEKGAEA